MDFLILLGFDNLVLLDKSFKKEVTILVALSKLLRVSTNFSTVFQCVLYFLILKVCIFFSNKEEFFTYIIIIHITINGYNSKFNGSFM